MTSTQEATMTATTATSLGRSHATRSYVTTGMTMGAVRSWLRLEGLAAFAAGLVLYDMSGGEWLWVIPALLLPDLSAAGFLAGARVGTFSYNLVHNWAPG